MRGCEKIRTRSIFDGFFEIFQIEPHHLKSSGNSLFRDFIYFLNISEKSDFKIMCRKTVNHSLINGELDLISDKDIHDLSKNVFGNIIGKLLELCFNVNSDYTHWKCIDAFYIVNHLRDHNSELLLKIVQKFRNELKNACERLNIENQEQKTLLTAAVSLVANFAEFYHGMLKPVTESA